MFFTKNFHYAKSLLSRYELCVALYMLFTENVNFENSESSHYEPGIAICIEFILQAELLLNHYHLCIDMYMPFTEYAIYAIWLTIHALKLFFL